QAGCEVTYRFVDKFDSRGRCRFGQRARKDVIFHLRIEGGAGHAFFLELERDFEGLSSPEDGVDRVVELSHAIAAFWAGTVEPVYGAVGARDEAIGADGHFSDDFAFVGHTRSIAGHIVTPNDGERLYRNMKTAGC